MKGPVKLVTGRAATQRGSRPPPESSERERPDGDGGLDSSGLVFRIYCTERNEILVMGLSPNDTVARCLVEIQKAFERKGGALPTQSSVPANGKQTDEVSDEDHPLRPMIRSLFYPTNQNLYGYEETSSPATSAQSPPTSLNDSASWVRPSSRLTQSNSAPTSPYVGIRRSISNIQADEIASAMHALDGDIANGSVGDDDTTSEDEDIVHDVDDEEDANDRKKDNWKNKGIPSSQMTISSPSLPVYRNEAHKGSSYIASGESKSDGRHNVLTEQPRKSLKIGELRRMRSMDPMRMKSITLTNPSAKAGFKTHSSDDSVVTLLQKEKRRSVDMSHFPPQLEDPESSKLTSRSFPAVENEKSTKEKGFWLDVSKPLIEYNFKHGTLLVWKPKPVGSITQMVNPLWQSGPAVHSDTETSSMPPSPQSSPASTTSASRAAGPTPLSAPVSPPPNRNMGIIRKSALSREDLCSEAAHEILTTERTYRRSLETLLKVFIIPLQEQPFWTAAKDKELSKSMFTYLESIFSFHNHLLEQLEARMQNYTPETMVGDILVQMAPFLKLYSEYCLRYDKFIAELKKMFNSDAGLLWLRACMQNEACHNLNIFDFLIMPIQRIPRYQMLIEALTKYTPPEHADYDNLIRAKKKIVDVAKWVDGYKTNIEQMANLSTKIQGMHVPLMQAGRKFIFQGPLSKKPSSGKSGAAVTRHFFLFSDIMVYTQEKRKIFIYKGSINLFPPKYNLCVQDVPSKKCTFQIVGKRNVLLVLTARNQQEKDNWIRELNNVLHANDNNTQSGSGVLIRLKRGCTTDKEAKMFINSPTVS